MKSMARGTVQGIGAEPRPFARRIRLGAQWLALTAVAVALTGLALTVTMRPSRSHVLQIALFLAISGIVSVTLGQVALWLADVARIGSVWLRLLLPPALTTLVIAFNVLLVSRLMFIANADAQILLGFLLFGIALALMLSFSIASEMTHAITRIATGAQRIAAGDYGYRIDEAASGGA